jgi:hypothetical protein
MGWTGAPRMRSSFFVRTPASSLTLMSQAIRPSRASLNPLARADRGWTVGQARSSLGRPFEHGGVGRSALRLTVAANARSPRPEVRSLTPVRCALLCPERSRTSRWSGALAGKRPVFSRLARLQRGSPGIQDPVDGIFLMADLTQDSPQRPL